MGGPTLGDRVHYRSYGTPGGEYPPACRAAQITAVGAWVVQGRILDPTDWHDKQPDGFDAWADAVRAGTADMDGPPPAGTYRGIVEQWDLTAVALIVFNPTGIFIHDAVPFDPAASPVWTPGELRYRPGSWHWSHR